MAAKKTADEETAKKKPRRAILFEMENIAIKGRQIVYDVLKSVLADKNIELTPCMFSQYCLHPSVKHFLPALLESVKKKRLSKGKLTDEITQGIRLSFTDDSLKLETSLGNLLNSARERDILLGALSSLDLETVRQLAENLGVTDMEVNLLSYPCEEDKNFPSADAWLKLAKKMSVLPPLCVVLATTSMSCKAALSAGMQCVVITDKFTGYQDFGGADYVADDLSDDTVKNIFNLLKYG